jgi:hypothetical protein
LFQILYRLSFINYLSKILYFLIGVFTLILCIFSFKDFLNAKNNNLKQIKLKLPKFLNKMIHSVIRKQMKMKYFILFSFVTGLVISVLEFACTGQIYFPTIMYVIGVPELKTRAISMLLLYCFMFVLPLIIIFLLAGYGIKLKKLINISKKNTVYSKLLISLIFLFLSIYMFYTALNCKNYNSTECRVQSTE